MDKLKVYDLYLDGKGLFDYMDKIDTLPFKETQDIKSIDLTFITMYGDREISKPAQHIIGDKVTDEGMRQLATMLYGMYYNKWDNLYKIYRQEVDLDSYVSKTTENVTDDGTNSLTVTNTDKTTDTHEVTGYNSSTFTDSTQDTTSTDNKETNEGTNSNTKDKTRETKGSLGNRIDDRRKALETLKTEVLSNVVYKDTIEVVGSLML